MTSIPPSAPARPRACGLPLLFLIAACAYAADVNRLEPQGYVSDFAGVLDAPTRAELERYCGSVEQATGAQMAIVTIDTTGDAPIEDFANALFRKWGIGKKGKDEGVMLLVAVRDRKWRIEVGYGLEPTLPDAFADDVGREMIPSLRQNDYGHALIAAAAEIGSRIAQAKGVALNRSLPRRGPPPRNELPIPWPLLLLFLLILLGMFGRRSGGGFLAGMLLGNLLGQPRDRGSGWGGGGFGGYDGGGGFGGFGGGDSGGGGASGSW
ncbi:MAG TPA: TPM domain-containing protein [Bryobacteraceae bacterium]|nr:TPM domain-containing protein [Bryobacteraceae bacterium]